MNIKESYLFKLYSNIGMYFHIITLFYFVISPLAMGAAQNDLRELKVVRNIVFMRTEGLAMVELLAKHCSDKRIQKICNRSTKYYKDTQPVLLELCKGMDLKLSKEDMESLFELLENGFKNYDHTRELDYLLIYEEHVNRSIKIYAELAKENRWDQLAYFSLKALPELFNLKQEMRKIIKK